MSEPLMFVLHIFKSANKCEINYSKCLNQMKSSLRLFTVTIARKIPKLHPKTSHSSEGLNKNQ